MNHRYQTENELLQMKIENALHQVQRIILIAVLLLLLAVLAWVLTIRTVSKRGSFVTSRYTHQVAQQGDCVKAGTWYDSNLPSLPPGMALFARSVSRRADMSSGRQIGQPRGCNALTGLLQSNSAVINAMMNQGGTPRNWCTSIGSS